MLVISLFLVLIPINNFEIIPRLISYGSFRNQFVEPIDVKFTTANPKNIKIFRTSSKAKQVELEKYSDDGSRFILRGLSIVFLNDELKAFEELTIKLGSKVYIYKKADIINWTQSNSMNKEARTFNFPPEFTTTSPMTKLFFLNNNLFQVINWTPHFYFGVFTLLMLIIFYGVIFKASRHLVSNFQLELKTYPWKSKYVFVALGISGLFFFIALYFSRLGVDVHHQGFVFHAAMRLSEGKVLFREVYYHYGALIALLHSWALKIFGVRLYSLNILTSVFYFFIALVFMRILGRFLKNSFVIFFTIVWLFFTPFLIDTFLPWSSVISLFLLMFSLNLTLAYIEKKKYYLIFCSGVIAGLCFWARQSVGPLLIIAQVISISTVCFLINKDSIYSTVKKNLIFISGSTVISLPFLIWIKSQNAFSDWWLQNMSGQGEWAFGGPIYKLKTIIKIFDILLPFSFWSVLPFVTVLLLVILIKKFFDKRLFSNTDSQLVVICIVALASWPQYFPIPCNRHYFWAGTPMFILFAIFFSEIAIPFFRNNSLKSFSTLTVLALVSIFVSTVVSEIIFRSKATFEKLTTHIYTIESPYVLKGMKIPSNETVDKLKEMDEFIQNYLATHKVESIVGEEMYNQLFLTLLPKSELSSPLPSMAFNYGPLKKKYEFTTAQEKFILDKKPLIYSPKPLTLDHYQEIFHLKLNKPLEYLSAEIFFYAPITDKVGL
jgi:hypothetical protein